MVNSIITLYSSKKVKILTACILYIIAAIFGFLYLGSGLNKSVGTAVLTIFLAMLIFGGYILFNTENKLVLSNLFLGFGMLFISVAMFSIVIYILKEILILTLGYLIVLLLTGVIIYKLRFFSFEKRSDEYRKNSFYAYMLGATFGSALVRYILEYFSLGDSVAVYAILCSLLSYGSMFFGLMLTTKYLYINSRSHAGPIIFDYD